MAYMILHLFLLYTLNIEYKQISTHQIKNLLYSKGILKEPNVQIDCGRIFQWPIIDKTHKDYLGGREFLEFGAKFITPPSLEKLPSPLEKYIYIKLLVLVGFDLNFPLISGINKLFQIKASFPTFQLSPCFISFYNH